MVMSEAEQSSSGRQRQTRLDCDQGHPTQAASYIHTYSFNNQSLATAKSPPNRRTWSAHACSRDIMRRAGVVAFDAKSPLSAVSCCSSLLACPSAIGQLDITCTPEPGGTWSMRRRLFSYLLWHLLPASIHHGPLGRSCIPPSSLANVNFNVSTRRTDQLEHPRVQDEA